MAVTNELPELLINTKIADLKRGDKFFFRTTGGSPAGVMCTFFGISVWEESLFLFYMDNLPGPFYFMFHSEDRVAKVCD